MKRPLLLAATLTVLATSALAGACDVEDPIWIAGHTAAASTLTTGVAALGTSIATQRALTLEMLLSAMKVNTAQISTNGAREVNLASNTNQAVASTLSQITQRQALVDAREQYSYETGQGVNACDSIGLMNATNGALGNVSMTGRESYRDLDVSPGKITPMPEATRRRLANPMKTDAAVLLDPNASDADRKTVIEAMTGLPMPKPTPGMPGSEADLMMLKARRVEALRSPALVSLSSVRAMSATEGHVVGSTATSLMQQLEQLVGQYGGGAEFEKWSAALAGQSEHGLLLELARLRSMSLTLRQSLIDQQARTTAVFGTMLATQAGGDL